MIEFKSPSEKDVESMREFASVIDNALTILGRDGMQHVVAVVASKLQEALMWYSHGVLNSPVLPPVQEAAQEVKAAACQLVEDAA